MKKLLLASAITVLSVSAQAAPTVYGKAFLSLDYQKDARTQLNSNASRIGFKGSESVSPNNDLVYQLEYRLDVDANGGRNFESRDTYIGLANKQLGTVLVGRLTAIDDHVNYANVAAGANDGILASFDAPRANNAIAYVSPSYSGLNFLGMYVMDENGQSDSFWNDAVGVAVKYEPANANYRGGISYIKVDKEEKYARVSGAFDINQNITIGALYQNGQDTRKGSEKENALTVSGEFKTATPWTAYGQIDLVDNAGYVKDAENKRFVAGGKYAFSKTATGHLYGSVQDTGASSNTYGVGAGLEYKF